MTISSTKASAIRLFGIAVLTLATSGCSTMTVANNYCDIAKPIILAKGEAAKLSDATNRQILTHDETWEKLCRK